MTLRGVRVEDGGAIKPSKMLFRIGGILATQEAVLRCRGRCDVRDSVFVPNWGDGVEGSNLHFENNVMYHTATALRIRSPAYVVGNVMIDCLLGSGAQNFVSDLNGESSAVVVYSGTHLVYVNNAVAGAAGPGITMYGVSVKLANFHSNVFHACRHGFAMKGGTTGRPGGDRGIIGGFTLWQIRDIGIWGYMGGDTPTIANVTMADVANGLIWSQYGPSPLDHAVEMKRLTVMDSLFVGRSITNPRCGKVVGIHLPVSTSAGAITPEQCLPRPPIPTPAPTPTPTPTLIPTPTPTLTLTLTLTRCCARAPRPASRAPPTVTSGTRPGTYSACPPAARAKPRSARADPNPNPNPEPLTPNP